MIIAPAQRTECIQEYYFSRKNKELASLNAQRAEKGQPAIINLGIGAPDGRPPQSAIDALCATAQKNGVHKYQPYTGTLELRTAFADWYRRFYHVELDPTCEIQPLTGSKEGILMISLTFLNPGDKALVPSPGYPTYTSATRLAGADVLPFELKEENGWMPDFDALEAMDLSGVKLMWINYPNMPTGAPASHELYAKVVDFAKRHGILVVSDNPYSFILSDEQISIFEVPGARECCLEMNSLSKAHNMSGWRLGIVAGEKEYIKEILKVKSQMDSGIFRGLQDAAVAALSEGPEWFEALNAEYRQRRELVGKLYSLIGAGFNPSSCGLFVFSRVQADNRFAVCPEAKKNDPDYVASFDARPLGEKVSEKLLHDAGVFITPGYIFGNNTSAYIRASLCADRKALQEAIDRVSKLL